MKKPPICCAWPNAKAFPIPGWPVWRTCLKRSSAGLRLPGSGKALISVSDKDKEEVASLAADLVQMGFELIGTHDTANYVKELGIPISCAHSPGEGVPNVVDLIRQGEVGLIVNTPTRGRSPETNGFKIRRAAVDYRVPCLTSLDTARAVITVMKARRGGRCPAVPSLNEYIGDFTRTRLDKHSKGVMDYAEE
ncbi:MAG: hypothetical protein GX228_10325 [Firmicutes bacterium]|jgi:carbamoyl-phosphate synthase large subunit|nr:hypothetical protein [Bacillota bacterium]NLL89290.1 hypothetical protein [Bacillota bacterium]HKM16667.1 hypothetical protein [Limnochordia bacterium]